MDERQRAEGLELPEIHFFPGFFVAASVSFYRHGDVGSSLLALLSRSRNRASAIASNGMEAL